MNGRTFAGRFFDRVAGIGWLPMAGVCVAALTAMLFAMGLPRTMALTSGTEILLETLPRDPRSILSGDYVVLNYKISRIPESMFASSGSSTPGPGSKVFVILRKMPSGYWEAAAATMDRPSENPSGAVVIAGRYGRGGVVKYGLEEYYVPEGTGRRYEDRSAAVDVRARISSDGTAALADVTVRPGGRTGATAPEAFPGGR